VTLDLGPQLSRHILRRHSDLSRLASLDVLRAGSGGNDSEASLITQGHHWSTTANATGRGVSREILFFKCM
jgi:hypothetical protein